MIKLLYLQRNVFIHLQLAHTTHSTVDSHWRSKPNIPWILLKNEEIAGMLLTSLSVTYCVSKYAINYSKKIIFRLGYTIRRIRMFLCFSKSYSDKYSSHLKKVFYDRLEDVTS